jgi:tetratricopeptide (TPR) repeat protein
VKESSGARRLVASYRERFEAEEYVKSHPETKLVLVEEYIESGEKKKSIPNYEKSLCGIFPRMHSSAGNHIADYKEWSNYHDWNTAQGRKKVQALEQTIRELEQEQKQIEYYLSRGKDKLEPGQRSELQSRFMTNRKMLEKKYQDAIPTKAEDIRFFLSYQTGWMYLRYFMWNFAGRQNDSQGGGDILDGNWISGINAIDADRIGNQDHLTSNMLSNHGRNAFFYLPLILGLIGIIFQLTKHPKDFSVVALLFLLTGWAIVVYLNQTPQQPRERDYAYAGSFYAFAIWIGLSVIALFEAVKILDWKKLGSLAAMSLGGSAVIFALEHALKDSSALGLSLLFISAVIVAMVALMMVVRGKTDDQPWKAFLAVIICLPAPILMCADGWDDHSRANRRTGVDMAWNYLSSIDQNGIIFTNGDNDTFPLWYAQEVEGTRTDVRVVNLSLLNTDWYIDQMKRQAYESAPVPFSIPEQKYRQGTRDVLFVDPYGEADKTGYMSVKDAIAFCLDEKNTIDNGGKLMHYLPTYKLKMEIDSATRELFRPMLKEGDSLVFELRFQLSDDRGKPKSYITKAQLMCLDLLANMDWKRPVYFAVTTGGDAYMGLENYFQLEGLAYRLTPILHPRSENPNLEGGVGTDQMYHKMMDLFRWGNMDKYDIYMDENNRRMTSNLRLQFSHLADALVNEGKKDEAIKVLDRCLEVMPEKTVPYDQPQIMWQLAEIYYDAGDSVKALNLSKRLIELGKEDLAFYNSLDLPNREKIQREFGMRVRVMDRLVAQAENHFPNDPEVKKLSEENNALISTELMEELGIDPRERQMVRTGASSARRPSPKAAPDSTTVVNFGNDTITKKRVSKKN